MELRIHLQPGELTEALLRQLLALAGNQAVELTLRTAAAPPKPLLAEPGTPKPVLEPGSHDPQQLADLHAELDTLAGFGT